MRQIFKAIVGSTSYGTNLPTSDVDYKGVYIQSHDELLGFGYKEQYEVGKDETYYEVRRFIELLQHGNPTVLELLFSPPDCIVHKEIEFDILVKNRHRFLTKKCRNSFGGYAVQQIRKARGLNKKMNWEKAKVETKKTPLDFCWVTENGRTFPLVDFLRDNNMEQEQCGLVALDHIRDAYALYYGHHSYNGICGENSNEVRLSSVPKWARLITTMFWNRDAYSIHCKEFKEYQEWLEKRNTERYVDTQEHGQQIDGKNLLHCRRLLDVAMEIALEKTIRVRRPNADYLLSIRKGKVVLDDIINQAEEDIKKLDEIYNSCDLPDEVDPDFCNSLLLEIRHLTPHEIYY